MTEPDFSGIDPLRVPEARRRIEALNKYLEMPQPTTADATRIAAGIGLSRWQFQRLARVWREHRNPSLLVVGRRGVTTRQYGVAQRAMEIAMEEITNAGADAELCSVAPKVEQRCHAEGVSPPSRPTIWNYMRKARATSSPAEGGAKRIVVGRMWFHLPLANLNLMTGTDMPALLIAVAQPERIILAYRISVDDGQPPSVEELVSELLSLRSPGAEARPLLLEADDRRVALGALVECGLADLRSHNRSVQREVSRAFGGRLGPLRAVYRRALARPKTKPVVHRQDTRISPEEAKVAISEAIEASNRISKMPRPTFDIPPYDSQRLS